MTLLCVIQLLMMIIEMTLTSNCITIDWWWPNWRWLQWYSLIIGEEYYWLVLLMSQYDDDWKMTMKILMTSMKNGNDQYYYWCWYWNQIIITEILLSDDDRKPILLQWYWNEVLVLMIYYWRYIESVLILMMIQWSCYCGIVCYWNDGIDGDEEGNDDWWPDDEIDNYGHYGITVMMMMTWYYRYCWYCIISSELLNDYSVIPIVTGDIDTIRLMIPLQYSDDHCCCWSIDRDDDCWKLLEGWHCGDTVDTLDHRLLLYVMEIVHCYCDL